MENIFLQLLSFKTEKEVSDFLNNNKVFKDRENWKVLGKIENNKGTIESQGNNPIKALVEKITNSIDAILMKECYKKNIDPKSQTAPKSVKEALKKFFNIEDSFISLSKDSIDKLASQIYVVTENFINKSANIYIIDKGEGQKPEDFEETFLSMGGNKDDIFFTHGRFGIGSFGVLANAGENGYQLILSRKFNGGDWGWTIIRKYLPEGHKHSRYEFFTLHGKIPTFEEKDLTENIKKIIRYEHFDLKNFDHGTLIKLYNYALPKISDIDRDLSRSLDRYLCEPSLPYRILNLSEKTKESHVGPGKEQKGNLNRLKEWKNKKWVEDHIIYADLPYLSRTKIYIYLGIKRDEKGRSIIETEKVTTKDASIFFIFNGQAHGEIDRYFLEDDISLNYIHKDLAIYVDCSHLKPEIIDKIFSPTREQARDNPAFDEIKNQLINIFRKISWFKEKDEQRKGEIITKKIGEDKSLDKIVEDIVLNNKLIKQIITGTKTILDPFQRGNSNNENNFKGKPIPTYLKCLDKEIKNRGLKEIPINTFVKIIFETDAENGYFENNRGQLVFKSEKNLVYLKHYSLIDGKLTLFLEVKDKNSSLINSIDEVNIEVTRPFDHLLNPNNTSLSYKFNIKISPFKAPENKPPGDKKNPSLNKIQYPPLGLLNKEQMEDEEDLCKIEIIKDNDNKHILKKIWVNRDYPVFKNFIYINNIKEKTKIKWEKIFYTSVWLTTILLFKQQIEKNEYKKEKLYEMLNSLGEVLIHNLFTLKEKYFLEREE